MSTMTATEPIYYVHTSFSGVGFAGDRSGVPNGAHVIDPKYVDADVREQGRMWMADRTVASVDCDDLTAGQVVLALMLGQEVRFDNGNLVTKAEVHDDGSILLWDVDGDFDGYAVTEPVGAKRIVKDA